MRRLTTSAAALSVLLAAACGTTVSGTQLAQSQPAGQPGAAGGLSAPGGAPSSGGTGLPAPGQSLGAGPAVAGSTGAGGAANGGSTAGGGAVAAPGGTGGGSRTVPVEAPGITATTVFIGLPYCSQCNQENAAIGAAGAGASYDTRNVDNAVIDYANAHGGFAGRKLQAIYFNYDATTDTNTQDQAACATWTQDHKVFALMAGDDILDTCAEKAHAIPLYAGSATAATFRKYPHLIDPDDIELVRLGQVTTTGLYRSGYFTGKLGLVTWDDPNYRAAIADGYDPTLSKYHITPTQTVYITVPQQMGALGDMSAAVSSAITKFRSLGIDHVIIQDGPAGVWAGTGLTLEWMEQAKSQQYYPRYGQNVDNSPGWSVLPSDEMNQAIAVDASDYDTKFDQGWHPNTTRQKCFAIEAAAGMPVSSGNASDEAAAGQACDYLLFLQAAMNHASVLSPDGFISAAESLGTSLGSALLYGTNLFPGRRDGGDTVRNEEYLASCQCLKYLSAPYSVG